jgi:hypothetical protein
VAPVLAAATGVYLHGLAGDLACRALGPEAMIASDLLEKLPEAIRAVKEDTLPLLTPFPWYPAGETAASI